MSVKEEDTAEMEGIFDNDDGSEMSVSEDENGANEVSSKHEDKPKVYLPGAPVESDEELVCDQSAYRMLHQVKVGLPCLSFDILPDCLGEGREDFPVTAYVVAGTQAPKKDSNCIIVSKLYNMHETYKEDNSESDSETENDEEDTKKKPLMKKASIKHQGCVNRIRTTVFKNTPFAASWSELGRVNIWDLTSCLHHVGNPSKLPKPSNDCASVKPVFTFTGHQTEGYGIDWSPVSPGVLATGDCKRGIHIWQPKDGVGWAVDQRPLVGHTDSVEDLQWSPNENNVLASCSVDKSIRIWDVRVTPAKACMLTAADAHESDVNVISWNRNEPLIVSGGDDGMLHIWDLRQFKSGAPVASLKHHTDQVTSVEWHNTDASVFASGGADNQIALWDLSVERDAESVDEDFKELPPQLLFIHQGQTDIKELHWHQQVPGLLISTALNGFNVLRTISV